MAYDLFYKSGFIRLFDVYETYIKNNNYVISFEQFYLTIFQLNMNLYCQSYNISIKSDAYISTYENYLNIQKGSLSLEAKLMSQNAYREWIEQNKTKLKTIHEAIDLSVNKYSLDGGLFFEINAFNHFRIFRNEKLYFNFTMGDVFSIYGKPLFNYDVIFGICENYIVDIYEINTSPTRFEKYIEDLNAYPEIAEDDFGTLINSKLILEELFLCQSDAIALLTNQIYEDTKIQNNVELNYKGISKDKIEAKRYAKNIAEFLWHKDLEKKIKISEMAIQVFVEMKETKHSNQLPDKAISLKKWIETVAPDYARLGGRPNSSGE